MRIAYLDCFSGISGDMFLGALVDAGVPAQLLEETVAALGLGARLEISRVSRGGISAMKVDVYFNGEKDMPREEYTELRRQREHVHTEGEHEHRHQLIQLLEHNYGKAEFASHTPAPHQHPPARGLKQIREIIKAASISAKAKANAIGIFEALGEAEAKIHDCELENVHFHETGAVDAIVDIVCAAVGTEALGVNEMVCSPLNVGSGTVKCAHGTLPVPAPATLELLKDAPVYSSGIQVELVTPTGAAIVKKLVSRFSDLPQMKIDKIGYGAGTRDFSGHANVMRLTLGESSAERSHQIPQEVVTVLEANLDDLNPQVFGYVMTKLMDEGALDAFAGQVQMKKNRPGTLLTVLCNPADATRLSELIFRQTTTLGIRRREEKRDVLTRNWSTVATQWGNVRMKIGSLGGTVTNFAPEYEDCRRVADEHHVPLKMVMQEAVQAYLRTSPQKLK